MAFTQMAKAWLWRNVGLVGVVIFCVAFFCRFYRLAHPNEVVFDEVLAGQAVNNYYSETDGSSKWDVGTRKDIFGLTPPGGKLFFYFLSRFFGYEGTDSFENIMDSYNGWFYAKMRGISALLGSVQCLLAFVLARSLNCSVLSAFCSSFLLIVDMSSCVQQRLILEETIGTFFAVVIGTALVILVTVQNQQVSECRHSLSVSLGIAGVLGIFSGLTMSIRMYSGLSTLIVATLFTLVPRLAGPVSNWQLNSLGRRLLRLAVFYVATCVVFVAVWYVHWRLLPFPIAEDQTSAPPMSWYDPANPTVSRGGNGGGFFSTASEVVTHAFYQSWRQWTIHRAFHGEHHWMSMWYDWLYTRRGVNYWTYKDVHWESEQSSKNVILDIPGTARIYLLGNIGTYWATFAAVLVAIAIQLMRRGSPFSLLSHQAMPSKEEKPSSDEKKEEDVEDFVGPIVERNALLGPMLALLTVFCCHLWFYITGNPPQWLFQYQTALFFATVLAAVVADYALTRETTRMVTSVVVCALTTVVFAYYSPWVFGTPTRDGQKLSMIKFEGWN